MQLYNKDQLSPGATIGETRNLYLINPTLKFSMDPLGITILIIKHGEDIQMKVISKQSPKDTERTIKCQPPKQTYM
jgi:hypothetical protein